MLTARDSGEARNFQLGSADSAVEGNPILGLDACVTRECGGNQPNTGVCPGYSRLALSQWSLCRNFAYVFCSALGHIKGQTGTTTRELRPPSVPCRQPSPILLCRRLCNAAVFDVDHLQGLGH